jgi:hypothetical protein
VFGPYDQSGVDPFHVYQGDEPYFRAASAHRAYARFDLAAAPQLGQRLRFGAGGAWDRVHLEELDIARPQVLLVDSLRRYRASGPSEFAYLQHRFEAGGLILNDGLRLQAFSARPDAPGSSTILSLSPRLGIAYPVSVRDAFSFAYARIEQDPARDFLYESRVFGYDRHPLGNPQMQPAEVIEWQGAVKHILDPAWSVQFSVFARDVYGEPGVRYLSQAEHLIEYDSIDDAHTSGLELDLSHTLANGGWTHWSWTFMHAWGRESQPEGLPFGAAFGERPLPTGNHPLDWDLQNMLGTDGRLPLKHGLSIAWSSQIATGRPWTPLYRDDTSDLEWPPLYADQQLINSRRMKWTEVTNLDVRFTHVWLHGATLRLAVTNLFDHRGDVEPTLNGYPNPLIDTLFDEYDSFRTETGHDGGGYWNSDGTSPRTWYAVHDPRLAQRPREVRLGFSIGE